MQHLRRSHPVFPRKPEPRLFYVEQVQGIKACISRSIAVQMLWNGDVEKAMEWAEPRDSSLSKVWQLRSRTIRDRGRTLGLLRARHAWVVHWGSGRKEKRNVKQENKPKKHSKQKC